MLEDMHSFLINCRLSYLDANVRLWVLDDIEQGGYEVRQVVWVNVSARVVQPVGIIVHVCVPSSLAVYISMSCSHRSVRWAPSCGPPSRQQRARALLHSAKRRASLSSASWAASSGNPVMYTSTNCDSMVATDISGKAWRMASSSLPNGCSVVSCELHCQRGNPGNVVSVNN